MYLKKSHCRVVCCNDIPQFKLFEPVHLGFGLLGGSELYPDKREEHTRWLLSCSFGKWLLRRSIRHTWRNPLLRLMKNGENGQSHLRKMGDDINGSSLPSLMPTSGRHCAEG